jgi:hypothetical protein
MEIWRFLGVRAELGEVVEKLPSREGWTAASAGRGVLKVGRQSFSTHPASPGSAPLQGGEYSGFYFLPGREGLVERKREFFQLSEKKFKIAKRAAWILHFIPTIKMIAICNNFYYRPQSDIDFFIITKNNRLWLTRFLATIVLEIFGLRARGRRTADKVCLSFYLSENHLNLENVLLTAEVDLSRGAKITHPVAEAAPPLPGVEFKADDKNREARDCFAGARNDRVDDPYFSYWLAFLEPIYGQECYNEFWEANSWLKNVFPNVLPKMPVPRRCVGSLSLLSAFQDHDRTGGITTPNPSLKRRGNLGDWLEKIAKKIQWRKISPRIKEMAALNDKRVVLNEAMLKFHENDRREKFREKFKFSIINYQSSIKNE